jgi:2-oxoglutarate ferredoxin oxidoreductase subunit delta
VRADAVGVMSDAPNADATGQPSSPRVIIRVERCKGCGLCVAVCPTTVLALGPLNARGYPAVVLTDNERCTSCTACALICPDAVLEVYKPPRGQARREVAPCPGS